ncbi:hypothetical protein AL713_02285 [Clostridium botulinum]|uniref:MBL fold metallo-hydrolase n=1 Tax=Clostridium botulinum TaxID=1491 RepID=UPI00099D50C1|nr:MBL fold metallo-hydrolase [Clostridium botulinum]OPD34207.1 hypothetical protein AL713_02285 [Clostridium botulinum]
MGTIEHDNILVTEDEYITLYVIGYEDQGESIILTIGNNKFAGVIDCYKTSKEFITKKILKELNVKYLDFICWTHIDWDHTYGISQLGKYINKDTAFILPEGITSRQIHNLINRKDIEEYHKKEYNKIYEMINNIDDDLLFSVNQTSFHIYNFSLVVAGTDKRYDFVINVFSPISGIVRQCVDAEIQIFYDSITTQDGNKTLNKNWYEEPNKTNNLYSVGLKVEIINDDDVVSICLCGDLDNKTIETMKENKRNLIFNKNTLIKIPHHGSQSADKLFDMNCIEEFQYAVTTSYKKKLPVKGILDKYKSKSTGAVSQTKLHKGSFGVVKYNILLKDLKVLKPEYENSAGEYIK